MALYTMRGFRRALTRPERTIVRNASNDEMSELKEELANVSSLLDTSDPYIQELIRAIPSMSTQRADALIAKEE